MGPRLAGPAKLVGLDVEASLFACPPPFEGRLWILELAHVGDASGPDMLAYLTPGPPSEQDFLPGEARLLGRLVRAAARRFQLEARPGAESHLVLVSVAYGERIGSAPLAPLAGGT